jgi:hypothetical protein
MMSLKNIAIYLLGMFKFIYGLTMFVIFIIYFIWVSGFGFGPKHFLYPISVEMGTTTVFSFILYWLLNELFDAVNGTKEKDKFKSFLLSYVLMILLLLFCIVSIAVYFESPNYVYLLFTTLYLGSFLTIALAVYLIKKGRKSTP